MRDDIQRRAREVHARADALEREVLTRWPRAWSQMDQLRLSRPMPWPSWCLVPMAAAVAVTTATAPVSLMPPPIAAVSALYAWRRARSVWMVEDGLAGRLLGQVPDALDADLLTSGMPEWCLCIATGHPEWPGSALWAHLEHDANTGRPELRLLIDMGEGGLESLQVIAVYLDRGTLTEAIADWRATALGAMTGVAGGDVRGGELDSGVARAADLVDGLVSLVGHLCRPEADITGDRPGARPMRLKSTAKDRRTWRVGYSIE